MKLPPKNPTITPVKATPTDRSETEDKQGKITVKNPIPPVNSPNANSPKATGPGTKSGTV